MTIEPELIEAQKKAFQFLRDDVTTELLYGGAAGGGKIVANDGVVLTPFGFKKGIDLNVGDLINNPDGTVQRIIQIKPEVLLPKWTVHFSDDTYTSVAGDHLWLAWKGRKSRKIRNKRTFGAESASVVETRELSEWLDRGYKPQIPVCSPQPFNVTSREKNKIDPYLLGVILGDGCTTAGNMTISCHEDDKKHYKDIFGTEDITYISKQTIRFIGDKNIHLKEKLKSYGLLGLKSNNKFIPKSYKFASVNDRIELIRGLMDTDGWSAKGKNACYYDTISEQLSEDVAFVLRSLGAVVTIGLKMGKYKKNGKVVECNFVYNLYIRYPNQDDLFKMTRKHHGVFGRNLVQKSVVDIISIGEIKGRCITVSNPNGLYITNDFIVTHNSWLGCAWIITSAIQYHGTRWLIGRSKLNALKETTMVTLFDIMGKWGIEAGVHYDYNQKDNYVQFKKHYGGSRILFKDLFLYPSDANFDSLGSLEITGSFIDEGNQIVVKAKNIIMSRIRYKLVENNLVPKLLISCNPAKNWVYTEFYRLWRDDQLPKYRQFIPAKVQENHHMSPYYVESLEKLDPVSKARLLDGNWEYDDDDTVLMDYDSIVNMFSISLDEGRYFITCDYGRFGKDPTVILVWNGWTVEKFRKIARTTVPECVTHIRELQLQYGVGVKSVVVDEAGNGSGVKDMLGCVGFVASHKPRHVRGTQENYLNLKAQCAYRFSEKVNKGEVAFRTTDAVVQEEVMQELEQIRRKDPDKDGKLNIEGKDVIREQIQRSTNWFDALMMRVLLDLQKTKRWLV